MTPVYGRPSSSEVKIVENPNDLFDDFGSQQPSTQESQLNNIQGVFLKSLSGASTTPTTPVEVASHEGHSKTRCSRASSGTAQTQASMIRRGSLNLSGAKTTPITNREIENSEADSSYAGSETVSERSPSAGSCRPGSTVNRLLNFKELLSGGLSRVLKAVPSLRTMPKILRTNSMASIVSDAEEREWTTLLAKDINKMACYLILSDQIKQRPDDESLRRELRDIPDEAIFIGCSAIFSVMREQVVNKGSFNLEEIRELRRLFKEIVNIKYKPSGENDSERVKLISQLYETLKDLPYEHCIQLIDGGLIRRLRENGWCDYLQVEAQFDLPEMFVLLDIPAVKMYLTYVYTQGEQYDTFSAILGMHCLYSKHFANSNLVQRKKCIKFANDLKKTHFHPASDLVCNISNKNIERLYQGLNFEGLSNQSDLQDAIRDRIKDFSEATNQIQGSLISDTKLDILDEQRIFLINLGEEASNDFYEHVTNLALLKMCNVVDDPRAYRENNSHFSSLGTDQLSPLMEFRELFGVEVEGTRARLGSAVADSRSRAPSIAEEKEAYLEGASIDDES